MNNPEQIKQQVLHAEAAIKSATDAYHRELHETQVRLLHEKDLKTAVFTKLLADLKQQYRQKAFDLALTADKVPYHTWGDRQTPTTVEVEDEGIWLYWDIHGDYAPEKFLATWEELTK